MVSAGEVQVRLVFREHVIIAESLKLRWVWVLGQHDVFRHPRRTMFCGEARMAFAATDRLPVQVTVYQCTDLSLGLFGDN
jgi:hypothetical protein